MQPDMEEKYEGITTFKIGEITLKSTITCPHCGHQATETMPTDSCQYFWECPSCGEVSKPKQGDCCVFRSYGDHQCPPIQQEKIVAKKMLPICPS